MILRIDNQKDYEKAVEVLKALRIDFEDDWLNDFKRKLATENSDEFSELYEDRVYRLSCCHCDGVHILEDYEFEKELKKETSELDCPWCGKTNKLGYITEY